MQEETHVLTDEEKKKLKEEAKEILEKNSSECELQEKAILIEKNKNIFSRIKSFFNFEKFEFLEQSNEKKEEIALLIKAQNHPDKLYWMEIVLSTLIATFGLLNNSVAVIIGAMLIAPLIRPMQGMSFAIARGQSSFFWKTSIFLTKSVVIAIAISFLFAMLIPLKVEQPEILARISPNILDLFIAIFSAIIALLSLGYERLSASVAGVAMAASLMPPLAVVGIELSLGNLGAAWGSFLLFFVNFLAILLVGVIVLVAYGFTPTQELKKKVSVRKIITLVIIILFTSIPLYSSLSDISQKIIVQKESMALLEKLIPEKIENAKLKGLHVLNITDDEINMVGELQVPENVKIFTSTKTAIIAELEHHFTKQVNIDFETILTANFSSPDLENKLQKEILTYFKNVLNEITPTFTSLQIIATEIDTDSWEISSIVSVPDGEYLTDEIKNIFAQKFKEKFGSQAEENPILFSFKWVTVAGSPKQIFETELTKNEKIQADIIKNTQEFLSRPDMNTVKIENIDITFDENTETNEINSITLYARVLYLKTEEKISENNNIAEELLTENLIPEITPFSIETNQSEENTIILKTEDQITEELIKNMKILPYSNITLELDYIPYTTKIIKISNHTNEDLNIDSKNNKENLANVKKNDTVSADILQ